MKRIILMIFSLCLTVSACKDEDMNKSFMPFDDLSALMYFQQSEEYSDWYKMMEISGLAGAYNFSTTPFTFFTVKNSVLAAYLKEKYGYDRVDQLTQAQAAELVKYHTVPNKAYEFTAFRDGKLPDSTSSGDYLSCLFVSGDDGGIFINRVCRIIKWDIEMVNGMVHELDNVIDPVMYTHYDFLAQDSRYSILKAAIDITGTDSLFAQLNLKDLPLKCRRTLFVTPDSVFEREGIHNLEDLIQEISPNDANYTKEGNPLNMYVRYRLIDGDYTTKELGEIMEYAPVSGITAGSRWPLVDKDGEGFTLPTLATNKLIQIQNKSLKYIFNKEMEFIGDRQNLQVRNGFVHEVNGIMKIFEPKNVLTIFEPTQLINFQIIKEYRNQDIQSTTISMDAKDFKPNLTWHSTPANKLGAVGYLAFPKGSYNLIAGHFLYGDCLYADLGPVGDITVVTRPIPAGTYNIRFIFMRTKRVGGIFQPFLDGEKNGASEISAYDAEWDSWPYPMDNQVWEKVTFDETMPHTITLKVTKPGELRWDLVRFEPVK